MNLPDSIPHELNCAFCNSVAKLEWQKTSVKSIQTTYLSYYCNNCKNGWTTNESDEISLSIYNSKKRAELRKNKIEKL